MTCLRLHQNEMGNENVRYIIEALQKNKVIHLHILKANFLIIIQTLECVSIENNKIDSENAQYLTDVLQHNKV